MNVIGNGKLEAGIRVSANMNTILAVSYTHLDVYKRQVVGLVCSSLNSIVNVRNIVVEETEQIYKVILRYKSWFK